MFSAKGTATSRGFVSGNVFLYTGCGDVPVPERHVSKEEAERESGRFAAARAETRRQLELVVADVTSRLTAGESDIFRNHLEILDDETLVSAIEKEIREGCVNAECAVRRAMERFRAVFERMDDPYLRERARDLDDVERRLLRVMAGRPEAVLSTISEPVVLVADDLTPSELISLPARFVLGLATDRGSGTSHVALLARAMGVPAVTGLGDITSRVSPGDTILLDGTNGTVTVNPDSETASRFAALEKKEREFSPSLAKPLERRGLRAALLANVQPGIPVGPLAEYGAEGVGLYRSEYLWLGGEGEPDEETQTAAYTAAIRDVAALGSGARTVFRVFDIGGDKAAKDSPSEANPNLGNRSIRFLLSRKDVFRTQLRAVLRAAATGPAAVMYPMVATVEELREANAILEEAKGSLRKDGIAFDETLPSGCMIETPSAALNAAAFAAESAFFSIGTNDLVQYTMAADRCNEQVAYLYQPANPAVLKLMDMTILAARDAGIPCTVCGESASDPVLGFLWVALGATGLSMSAGYIPALKKTLESVEPQDAAAFAKEIRALVREPGAHGIYGRVKSFLRGRVPGFDEMMAFFAPSGAAR